VFTSPSQQSVGRFIAVAACIVGASVFGAACGGDTLGVATTVVNVTPTNFATIPPVASTAPGSTTTLPANAVGQESSYTVQAGDSPISVASKYNISVTTLLAYNAWVDPSQFPYPGTVIKIPASAIVNPSPSNPGAGGTGAPGVKVKPGCENHTAGSYTIQSGDSLWLIQNKFKSCFTITALLNANNWPDQQSVVLLQGQSINIPAAG
jgi:LysM repeat protein